MQEQYDRLREQYQVFRFVDYQMTFVDGSLKIVYHFSIDGLADFAPSWTIPCLDERSLEPSVLQRLVFSLGMAELVSYWKVTCSPTVHIMCGSLSPAQSDWWKQLYYGGLGEFFYRNGIVCNQHDFLTIVSSGESVSMDETTRVPLGMLIPVGGGKDSIVTLNLLSGSLSSAYAYMINKRESSIRSAELAGIPKSRILVAYRTIAPELLALNAKGFLNGHTPFSAVVAFSSVLTAYLHNLEMVVLSNESSASEATLQTDFAEVNHQYSKSYSFEQNFAAYVDSYLRCKTRYFSLLRPLTEFQIARYFSTLPRAFHACFRSCNVGSKTDCWCGHCPKCLFVAVILSPFLPYDEVASIMGADLLNDGTMQPVLEELTGQKENKPFECVGSRKEVNYALCIAIDKMIAAEQPLPLLLAQYYCTEQYRTMREAAHQYGNEYDENNQLTPEFAALVKQQCVEPWNR